MPRVPRCLLLLCCAGLCRSAPADADHARQMLENALHARNPDTRKVAAEALGLGGPREPFRTELEGLLKDKDVQVRLAAIAGLLDWKSPLSLPALRRALDDPVPEVSFAAAKALYALHDPAGEGALLAIVSRESKPASSFLTQQTRDALRMLHTPRATFMMGVKEGLGFVPLPGFGEGMASLRGLLSDPGVSGRAVATLLLGSDKDPKTLAALRQALSDKDWSVRAAAIHSLALRNDPAVEEDLAPLMADKHPPVRLRAAAAWLRLEAVRGRNLGMRAGGG